MKKFFKSLGILIVLFFVAAFIFYFAKNEALPKGKQGKEADALAVKMLQALNHDAFENTELITWSFRGVHHYKWWKQKNTVTVLWNNNKVILNTKNKQKSAVFIDDKKVENLKILETAISYFNNDSFWLVAPYKIFDKGTERSIVKHNNKNALLVTYTSGGSTPGDSYLWILDDQHLPVSYKMWTSIIPIGGVEASWANLKDTEAGIKLPTNHKLSLFNLQLPLEKVKAYNPKANDLAAKILEAIQHKAYKNTRFIEWSFAGKRFFKWDKKEHLVSVSWDSIRVSLYPQEIAKSTVYFNEKLQKKTSKKIVKKAWNYFNNDSFWLVGPHKLFDSGTIRNIKKINNKDALYIKYTSGGSTPGDSYVWELDKNYLPLSYKMFIPSMKMKGVTATWQDWIITESGTKLPTNHVFEDGRNLSMGTVKAYH